MELRKIIEDLSGAKNALIYVISVRGRKKSPDLEPIIARSPNHAFEYALYVLRGRFPLGEPAIARSARTSLQYSQDILRGRFPLGEKALCKPYCHVYLSRYIKEVLREPSDVIEKCLLNRKDAALSVEYSMYSLKGRFPDAEEFIIKKKDSNKKYISFLQSLRDN